MVFVVFHWDSVFHFISGKSLASAIFVIGDSEKKRRRETNNGKHTNDTQVCHKQSVFTVSETTVQNYESTSMETFLMLYVQN